MKRSRQQVLHDLEVELLASQCVWTDNCTHFYEEILTNPQYKPLPLDVVVAMMYRSGFSVPHASVEKVLEMGGSALIAKQYQIVATHWSGCIPSPSEMVWLAEKGFAVHQLPLSLGALLKDNSPQSNELVMRELDGIATRKQHTSPNPIVENVALLAALTCNLTVLRHVPASHFHNASFMQFQFMPSLFNSDLPGYDIHRVVVDKLNSQGREIWFDHNVSSIADWMVDRPGFVHLKSTRQDAVLKKIALLNELEPLWSDKERVAVKKLLRKYGCPTLPVFQAQTLYNKIQSTPVAAVKRKM